MSMSTYFCQQGYCPHIHQKKCQNTRLQSIPLSIFPDTSVDTYTNHPIKSANQYKSNVHTVAYQNYQKQRGASNREANFVRHFYYSHQTASQPFSNVIVSELQDDMATRSAYVLAEAQSHKYKQEQKEKKLIIENARRKSKAKYNEYFRTLEQEKQAKKEQNSKWLKRLYRKLQQIAKHIIGGEIQIQTVGDSQKKFLLSKSNLTSKFLSQIKVRDPKVACEILEQLRILMLKKKLKFQQQRQEQDHNKSASMSFISDAESSTNQQSSMISETTTLNGQKTLDQEGAATKYCDFQILKKKWRCDDVEEIKRIIRRVLTNQILRDAEVKATRKRRDIDKSKSKKKAIKSLSKGKKPEKKAIKKVQIVEVQQLKKHLLLPKGTLSKQEQSVKVQLVSGGQFDAAGQRFTRTRNYSQMFKKREQQNLVDFCVKEKTLQFTRDCCCPNS